MTDEPRTPPQIVTASPDPERALAAFIAQELETWGFTVDDRQGALLVVEAEGSTLFVGVKRVRDA